MKGPPGGGAPASANRAVTFERPVQWYGPVQLTSSTLLRSASRGETLRGVVATLRRLRADDYCDFLSRYLEEGLARFGEDWGYLDLLSVLHAAARLLQPQSYLEIGVRRGRSLAAVATAWPRVDIVGFDLWAPGYAGMENPGPEFVAEEMRRLDHQGRLELVSGDSRETVPAFLKERPQAWFDLVTVDGDHSPECAAADLAGVKPRVKLGGVLVLDDVSHPQHGYLAEVWREHVGSDPDFDSCSYTDLGYGVAFAVRRRR